MALATFLPFSEIAKENVNNNKPITKLFARIPRSNPEDMYGVIIKIEGFRENLVT
jgi:hypothetical protein